jgi:hypothetical protein
MVWVGDVSVRLEFEVAEAADLGDGEHRHR